MKKFLKKHVSLVVIIIAIIVAGTNYLVYPLFIKKDMQLVEVPVAIAKINEQTKITPEMITKIEVVKNYLPSTIIKDENQIIGKYVAIDSAIASGGFFYNDLLSDEQYAMGNILYKLNENEYAYGISIDSTYSNIAELNVGHLLNIYVTFSYRDAYGIDTMCFGQLDENVRIIGLSEDKSYIMLALTEDELAYYELATKGINGNLIPILSYDSLGTYGKYTEYYDILGMRNYIDEKCDILTKSNILENVNEVIDDVNEQKE